MIKLYYIGDVENTQQLEKKIGDLVIFTNLLSEADCLIVESKPKYLKFLKDLNTSKPYLYLVENRKYTHLPLSTRYIFLSQSGKEMFTLIKNMLSHGGKYQQKINDSRLSFDKIILEANNIPILPTIMVELMTMSNDPDKTIKYIVGKIKMDQGLAAAVLRLANSPIYSFVNNIDSIDRALILLGFDEIKKLVSAVAVKPFFEKNFKYYNESGFRMWLHSFNVAKICYDVAKSYNNQEINKESIYLAGLMHDIGKTILVSYLKGPIIDTEDEKNQTGYTHMEIGSILLRHWNVSDEIIDSVANHHTISYKLFNKILYFANKREREDKINNKLKEDIDNYFSFKNNY